MTAVHAPAIQKGAEDCRTDGVTTEDTEKKQGARAVWNIEAYGAGDLHSDLQYTRIHGALIGGRLQVGSRWKRFLWWLVVVHTRQ